MVEPSELILDSLATVVVEQNDVALSFWSSLKTKDNSHNQLATQKIRTPEVGSL